MVTNTRLDSNIRKEIIYQKQLDDRGISFIIPSGCKLYVICECPCGRDSTELKIQFFLSDEEGKCLWHSKVYGRQDFVIKQESFEKVLFFCLKDAISYLKNGKIM